MENGKFIKIILAITGMIFIPVFCIDAYHSATTHPALTQEVIKLFEHHYSQYKFTENEKAIIEQGSADEDNPVYRCLFHFYDPIYEKGIKGNMSAKNWGQNTSAQAFFDPKYTALLMNMTQKLFGSETDFSFDRAVFEYAHNDKNKALESLGHILHLIEDMDVPAHTRDDSHMLGDPFEDYANQFVKGGERVDNIADELIKEGKYPIIYDNLNEYFYNLALFTNQNFFSEDTILIERYSKPIIDYEKKDKISNINFGYKKIDNSDYKLVRVETLYKNKVFYKQYYIDDIDNLILSDNWNILSKQAVLYGAGVIKLFFDAVEEEKKTLALYDKNESWLGKTKNKISTGVLSLADGALERVSEIMERVKSEVAAIDPQDMLATAGEAGEKAAAGDKQVEVANEDQNHPAIPETKPEDPGSPELQRLALILRETEKMVARLEKGINDLEKTANQAVGGTVENLTAQAKESGPVTRPIVEKQSFCGGSGGSGATASSAPVSSTSSTSQNFQENNESPTDNGEENANENDNNNIIAPDSPSLEISQCDNSISATSCLLATTTLDISWATTTACADFAYFNLDENGIFATTTATTTQITDLNDGDFTFSVAITDINGNTSATTTKTATINPMPIVINEIAWRGTATSSADEWVELYNRTNNDIDLSDWMLYSQNFSPRLPLEGIIAAKGYYLIERTDDDTISDISADLTITFSSHGWGSGSGLHDDGEHLILSYQKTDQATTTIDEAPFGNGWPTPDGHRTLERQNPALPGTDANNWALVSDNSNSWNGLDANGDAIKGTPRQENSDGSTSADIADADTIAPDVASLEISQCDNSISATSCLLATTTLDILWATTTPDADFAYFNLDENGAFSTTTATTTQITGLNDGDFTFSVATVDTSGNASATTTKIAKISQLPIVINEIAWVGTSSANPSDEWIELYNRSGDDIDLSDWMLYSQDGSPDLNFLNATDKIIEAGGYYLIESQDDNTISDISADLTLAFDENNDNDGLSNYGEHLILAYKKPNQATTTVDEVYFASDEGSWVDEDNSCSYGNCRTLERYNPDYICANLSDCRSNWALSIEYSASFDLLNGLDADGDIIRGTPRARNSVNYKIAKDDILSSDKTITKTNSPYFVGKDGLTINADATLTIEPGTVIKSVFGDNSDIVVKGAIQSNGSSAEPVVFTSFYDDEYGGDMNGDGDCEFSDLLCPGEANNFWSQIIFTSASKNSEFNHTVFRYGGGRVGPTCVSAMVVMDGATANFTNSTFENSYTSGAYFESATSTISNCTFQNNKTQIAYTDYHPTYYDQYYGLVALNGGITVQNSDFNHNQVGLGLFSTIGAVIDSNIFNHNNSNEETFPLQLVSSAGFTLTNNSGANNDKEGISVWGETAKEGVNTSLVENPLPYILEKGLSVSENSTLAIGPKTVFKFDDGGYISVSGQLNINGGDNEADRILFTSISDSVVSQSGINLNSASSTIENAEFRYLDKALSYIDNAISYAVASLPSAIDLKDVIFTHNTWSIYANPSDTPVIRAENVSCDSGTTNTTGICQ